VAQPWARHAGESLAAAAQVVLVAAVWEDRASSDNWYGWEHTDDSRAWFPKINFPTYDGEADPLPWLNKCGTYFRGMETALDECVWMASLHMEGATIEWYYALEHDVGLLPWTRFSEFVNMWFGLPLRTNDMADLKEL
jgi:hypothetical protein